MPECAPRGRWIFFEDEIEQQFYDWSSRKALAVDDELRGIVPSGKRNQPIDPRARELRAKFSTDLVAPEQYVAHT